MRKYVLGGIIFFILAVGVIEIVMRYQFGFLSAPLYVESPDYEYMYAPNQEVVRFGNTIRTNNLSMRNDPVLPTDTTVILLVGDSVVNGGSLTDQDSLASTLLEKKLSKALNQRVRVLNISAGSWGPDNVAAYLKKYGLFNADLICLVASSHDAHDIMGHEEIVGIDPNLPKEQYRWAVEELWKRYLYPRYFRQYTDGAIYFAPKADTLRSSGIQKDGEGFNPGFSQLASLAKVNNIAFFIYLHPEISEIESGTFNSQGQEIIQFARQNKVELVNELELGISKSVYREGDVVHYNTTGQRYLASKLFPLFLSYLSRSH